MIGRDIVKVRQRNLPIVALAAHRLIRERGGLFVPLRPMTLFTTRASQIIVVEFFGSTSEGALFGLALFRSFKNLDNTFHVATSELGQTLIKT